MRELRISTVVQLPDDAFEQGKVMAALAPAVAQFETAIKDASGQTVKVSADVVRPGTRGPRTAAAPTPSVTGTSAAS